MTSRRSLAAALALTALALTAPRPAPAATEPEVLYPAKVTTLQGRVYTLEDLGSAFEDGAFVFHDGAEQGRVSWRDLDKVVLVGNIGHGFGSEGSRMPRTRRATLHWLDGTTRTVHLVIGAFHGYDGVDEHQISARQISLIDFDEARIAPSLYNACPRGHVWEQEGYRFCPYDGERLAEVPLGR